MIPEEKIKKVCEIGLLDLGEEYRKRFDEEYKDLLNWKKHRGIDKAKELVELAKATETPIKSNKSGSLILFLLGISAIDPLKENLKFRQKPLTQGEYPDIDMDFDGNASLPRGEKIRDKVKQLIFERFGGQKHVCSIGTYGCYRTKMAIIDIARVLGYDVKEANAVTKEMDALKGFSMSDDESDDEESEEEEKKIDQMSLDEVAKVYPALQEYFAKYPDVKTHVEKIRGQVKSMGCHAGGVIITNIDLDDVVPLGHTTNGAASAWTEGIAGHELSAVGLIKFDVLGLNHLAIVKSALDIINEQQGLTGDKRLDRRKMPINDRDSIRKAAKDGLEGIFQLDSPATKQVVDAVKMDSLDDITAITALIRPGPKDMGIDMVYARRKNGEPYNAPQFWKDALADTYGCMIYQEQIMLISRVLAGFTPSEANKLRKACAKKVPELLVELKKKFIAGAQKRIETGELTEGQVEEIWENIQSFGAYGFNRSHSAAYSALTAIELHLKSHYPLPFFTGILNCTKLQQKNREKETKIAVYVHYLRSRGTKVLQTSVNQSKELFSIDGESIRFAFSRVKSIGSSAQEIIDKQPFADMKDFLGKIDKGALNKTKVLALLYAGAFDEFYPGLTIEEKRNKAIREFYEIREIKEEPPKLNRLQWKDKEIEYTSVCLSETPLRDMYANVFEQNPNIKQIREVKGREDGTLLGEITSVEEKTTKTGKPMLIVTVEDGYDSMKFFVFSNNGAIARFLLDFKGRGRIAAIPVKKSFGEGDMYVFDSFKHDRQGVEFLLDAQGGNDDDDEEVPGDEPGSIP